MLSGTVHIIITYLSYLFLKCKTNTSWVKFKHKQKHSVGNNCQNKISHRGRECYQTREAALIQDHNIGSVLRERSFSNGSNV
jgi:hypothetical protein